MVLAQLRRNFATAPLADSACSDPARALFVFLYRFRKPNPRVSVVQPAKDRLRDYVSDRLIGLVQGDSFQAIRRFASHGSASPISQECAEGAPTRSVDASLAAIGRARSVTFSFGAAYGCSTLTSRSRSPRRRTASCGRLRWKHAF